MSKEKNMDLIPALEVEFNIPKEIDDFPAEGAAKIDTRVLVVTLIS